LLRCSLLTRTVSGDVSPLSSTLQVLFTIIVSNVLVLPVLQHPVLRHTLPAFVAAVMTIGLLSAQSHKLQPNDANEYSTRGQQPLVFAATCAIALFGAMNVAGAYATRQMNAAQWDLAESLRRQGVPASQIAGGWAWFCAHELQPGQPHHESYVTRFNRLESNAPYRVTYGVGNDTALPTNERVLNTVVVDSPFGAHKCQHCEARQNSTHTRKQVIV
jgi:hypothetical protein